MWGGKAFKQDYEGDWASPAVTEPIKFNYSGTKSSNSKPLWGSVTHTLAGRISRACNFDWVSRGQIGCKGDKLCMASIFGR